jgi:hypothetical protein
MKVTKDVIADLFPLYQANECSQDTKILVDEFFRDNPDFARMKSPRSALLFPAEAAPVIPQEVELRAFARTRKLLLRRSTLLALAIFFSLAPLSFLYDNGRFHWLWRESPWSAAVYFTFGIVCWVSYAVLRRNLKDL